MACEIGCFKGIQYMHCVPKKKLVMFFFTFTFYSLFAELVFNKLGKYVRFTFTIFLFAESDKDTQEASSDHQQCDCTLL